ncbi:MAG: leucine-rich repeat domain-containing protein [Ruminococcaceae bacterium]|nr:leucine-rich repeat domain-containing protein [Oscillospiraceae bacterium]
MNNNNQAAASPRPRNKLKTVATVLILVLLAASAASLWFTLTHKEIGINENGAKTMFVKNSTTELDLSDSGLAGISGIEKCDALTSLSLKGMGLSSFDELEQCDGLTYLNLCGNDLSIEQHEQLQTALPDCKIEWEVPIGGEKFHVDTTTVDLGTIDPADWKLLTHLPALTHAESAALSPSTELIELFHLLPDCTFNWQTEVCGKLYPCDTKKLDFNDFKITDFEKFKQELAFLPDLRKVELCRSGLKNSKMEELIATYPDVKFVWELTIGLWKIRTDVTNFSSANNAGIRHPEPDEWKQLKYLTDIISLDIGHNQQPADLSHLACLTKLRAIILDDCGIYNMSQLSSLVNLEYVEICENGIRDMSAVASWTKLKEINIADNWITDFSPLYDLPYLKRVWLGKNWAAHDQRAEILANLPEDVELNTYIGHNDYAMECSWNGEERPWRPIDYTKWGFTYDNPMNVREGSTAAEIWDNYSSANIDTTPVLEDWELEELAKAEAAKEG